MALVKGETDETFGRIRDEELMAELGKADQQAFRELFTRYSSRVYVFLYHMTGERDMAQDLLQETFIRLYRSRERYDPTRPFRPWLFKIASNLSSDLFRSWFWNLRNKTRSLFESEHEESDKLIAHIAAVEKGPERESEASELEEKLRVELAGIGDPYRQAILLHDLEGMTCVEVADVMGRPVSTVLSWLRRGRRLLRVRLEAGGGKSAWM